MTQRCSFDKNYLKQEFGKLNSKIKQPPALFLIGGGMVFYGLKDLIMPLIGLAPPGLGNLATYEVAVMGQKFGIGDLVAVITFHNCRVRHLHSDESNR